MNRNELINNVAKDTDLTKKQVKNALESILSNIENALVREERVAFIGFGTFSVAQRKERKGINPQTKESITIPARKVPKFKPGKQLKEAVAK